MVKETMRQLVLTIIGFVLLVGFGTLNEALYKEWNYLGGLLAALAYYVCVGIGLAILVNQQKPKWSFNFLSENSPASKC